MVFHAPCVCKRCAHRVRHLSEVRGMGRRRRARADYRLCELRVFGSDRVSEGRTGVRHRLQNLYHCRAGDPVRHLYELGAGGSVLGRNAFGDCVRKPAQSLFGLILTMLFRMLYSYCQLSKGIG